MLGEILSAGGKLLDFFGSKSNAEKNREIQQQQMDLQKQFAQTGIQWKVADAKAAGIHPLFALGANTHSYSPISVGSTDVKSDFGSMGQDLGRAMMATASKETRNDAMSKAVAALSLEGAKVDLDIKKTELASRIARLRDNGNPPLPTGPVPEASKFEERPRLIVGGVPVRTDPSSVNAEDLEKRYGDIAQEIGGVINTWRDYQTTTGGDAADLLGLIKRQLDRAVDAPIDWRKLRSRLGF